MKFEGNSPKLSKEDQVLLNHLLGGTVGKDIQESLKEAIHIRCLCRHLTNLLSPGIDSPKQLGHFCSSEDESISSGEEDSISPNEEVTYTSFYIM